MHILFVNGTFPQPSQTFVVDQMRFARRAGHRITIFSKRYNRTLAEDQTNDLADLVIHDRPRDRATLSRLASGLSRRPEQVARYYSRRRVDRLHLSDLVCALQVDGEPDAILANFGQNGIVAARIKQAFFPRARLAVIFHGYDVSAYVAANGWEGYRRAAPAIDLAIAVNRKWAELLSANTPLRNVVVHHLGVDLERVGKRSGPVADRRFTILFVGRMVEKKGLAVLIAALTQLRAMGRDIELRVMGDGPKEADYRAATAAAGLTDIVTFMGSRPHADVLDEMGRCDCLALPSLTGPDGDQEGIPVTLMEAMAAGLPVVSTYHSGIPELVSNEETGLLVPERDATALAAALTRLIDDPTLARRLAANARRHVAANFNADTQNQALLELVLGTRDYKAPSVTGEVAMPNLQGSLD